MRCLSWISMAAVLLPSVLRAQDGAVGRAVASITAADYFRRISVIAHDSMMGRDTPSRGLDLTAQWVADAFRSFGLRPGGDDGGYLQRYPIQQARLDVAASRLTIGESMLRFDRDAVMLGGGFVADGVTAPLVFVSGTANLADALRDASLEHAVALVSADIAPNGNLSGPARGVVFGLVRAGAAAVVIVANVSDQVWATAQQGQRRPSTITPWRDTGRGPVLLVREPAVSALLSRAGVDLSRARQGAVALHRLELEVRARVVPEVLETQMAPNTVGILEGSDPTLREEYLVFSAHMDHVGTRCRRTGADSICNGADDDASGTTGIVELAEAFAMLQPRPRRSIIFLTVSGEERGLWGSDYFAGHPPVPLDHIVADLNADMIGRNWRDTIVVIGKEHSDLGATLNRVNRAHPELDMTAIDDLWPEERFYFRSDHYNFARRGVPILFFFNGTHPDYHRSSDHVAKIDSEKASRIVQLIFYLGLDVANADQRPTWNPDSYREIVSDR